MDERSAVEGSKDHVHLPVDVPQERRHAKRENAVPKPVGGRGERDSLSTDLGWEDLGWVRPGGWAPRGGEAGDEQVRASDNSLGHTFVVDDTP